MPTKINQPSIIQAAGHQTQTHRGIHRAGQFKYRRGKRCPHGVAPPVGRNRDNDRSSTNTPWCLKGMLRVESDDGVLEIRAGEAVIAQAGQWVRYSTPVPEGAEYIAVCPAGLLTGNRSSG